MPILPDSMLDFLSAPVPFIVGLAGENIARVENDGRLGEAMQNGLSMVNIDDGFVMVTSEDGIADILPVCSKLQHVLTSLQSRLELLVSSDFSLIPSGLKSFESFLKYGLTPHEVVTLRSIRNSFREHTSRFAGDLVTSTNAHRKYGLVNQVTNEFEFYPSFFLEPRQLDLKFQEQMVHTQLFVSFVDKKRKEDMKTKGESIKAENMLARWIYKHWRRKQERRKGNGSHVQRTKLHY